MAEAPGQQASYHPPQATATVADIMRPPVTTPRQNDHAAAAAYLMKHAGVSALLVLDAQTDQPIGIITEADITRAVADRNDLNNVWIRQLMTTGPAVIGPMTSIRDAAQTMTSNRFRHLPVVGDAGLVGMVDIIDVCRALLDLGASRPPDVDTAR
jgi:CBS domain-containing protein